MASPSLLLIVTGASRGLGRAICKAFCQDESIGKIRALLVARSAEGLQETANIMTKEAAMNTATSVTSSLELELSQHPMDLSDLEQLDENIDSLLQSLPNFSSSSSFFDHIVLINNAGSLGHVGPTLNSPSLQSIKHAVDFNITSALWWSVRVARHFQSTPASVANVDSVVTLVNISSLVAVKDFPTLAIYSAGKAARDRFHSVLAVEQSGSNKNSNLKVLNYAPGPLETDMSDVLRNSSDLDDSIKPNVKRQLIDPLDSARKLVKLVLTNEFTTGQHIDYYDL